MKLIVLVCNFQGCFRQNLTVVTIYASLGEEALIYSLNEVGVEAFLLLLVLLVFSAGSLNLGVILLTDSSVDPDMRLKATQEVVCDTVELEDCEEHYLH